MKRKIIGILAALVLASVGTIVLVSYVQSAKDKAEAGEPRTEVYVLQRDIPAYTPISRIGGAVELEEMPTSVVVDGAVTDLDGLDDELVSAVGMQAGEQLLTGRLVTAESLARGEVPDGLQELTIALDPERAVGGNLQAGDTVGVVMSFDPFDLDVVDVDPDATTPVPGGQTATENAEEASGESEDTAAGQPGTTPNMTHLTFHKVLVTAVQYDQRESTGTSTDEENESSEAEQVERAPSNALLVTLALPAPHVEQVVFAAEFGYIWLTAENAAADEAGTRIVTLGEAYADAKGQR
jgi:pilus assembly protein CpaB